MSFDAIVSELPVAGVIVVVVFFFVRYIEKENCRRDQAEGHRAKLLADLGERCHEHSKELNEVATQSIDRSSEAVRENTKALGVIAELMRGCADRANGRRPG